VITAIIWLRHYGEGEALGHQNLYITIVSDKSQPVGLSAIMEILKEFCSAVDLRRFDETKEVMEATFRVGFDEIARFEKAKARLQQLNENMEISFLDHESIIA
jgi:hypothetical protein